MNGVTLMGLVFTIAALLAVLILRAIAVLDERDADRQCVEEWEQPKRDLSRPRSIP